MQSKALVIADGWRRDKTQVVFMGFGEREKKMKFSDLFSSLPQTSMSAWKTTEAATISAVTQWDHLSAAAKRVTNFSPMNGRVKVSESLAVFSPTPCNVKTNWPIKLGILLKLNIACYFTLI